MLTMRPIVLLVAVFLLLSESRYSFSKQKGGADPALIIGGILVLLGVSGGLYWYFTRDTSPSPSPTNGEDETNPPTSGPPTSGPSPSGPPPSGPPPSGPPINTSPSPSPTSPWCDIISIPITGTGNTPSQNDYSVAYHDTFAKILYGDEADYDDIQKNLKKNLNKDDNDELGDDYPPDGSASALYALGAPYNSGLTAIDKMTADSICGLTCNLLKKQCSGMTKPPFCEIKDDQNVVTDKITGEHVEKYCDCKEGDDDKLYPDTDAEADLYRSKSTGWGSSRTKFFQDQYECCPNAYKRNNEGGCEFAVEDVIHQIRRGNGDIEECDKQAKPYCIKGQDILRVEEGDPGGAAVREKKRLTSAEYEIMCEHDEQSPDGGACQKSCGHCTPSPPTDAS